MAKLEELNPASRDPRLVAILEYRIGIKTLLAYTELVLASFLGL